MHGLLRVRHITQDDAHIFCRWDQVEAEVVGCLELAGLIYDTFGLDVRAELSTRPAEAPRQRGGVGSHGGARSSALATAGWGYVENPGDGAFYAPKIDLHMTDSIGRSWQMGTIQLDGWMPQRLDATYTTSEDELERPFMIHRALFGSFERFIGILIEHFAGAFPLWLAPVQVAVLPLSTELRAYADEVVAALRAAGLRAELDAREEKVGRKIHDAEVQKVPVMLVLGGREAEARSVAVRRRGGVDAGVQPLAEVVQELAAEARERRLTAPSALGDGPSRRAPAPPGPALAHGGAHGANERPHAPCADPLDAHLAAARVQRDVAPEQPLAAPDSLDRRVRQIARLVAVDEREPPVGREQQPGPGLAPAGFDGPRTLASTRSSRPRWFAYSRRMRSCFPIPVASST